MNGSSSSVSIKILTFSASPFLRLCSLSTFSYGPRILQLPFYFSLLLSLLRRQSHLHLATIYCHNSRNIAGLSLIPALPYLAGSPMPPSTQTRPPSTLTDSNSMTMSPAPNQQAPPSNQQATPLQQQPHGS